MLFHEISLDIQETKYAKFAYSFVFKTMLQTVVLLCDVCSVSGFFFFVFPLFILYVCVCVAHDYMSTLPFKSLGSVGFFFSLKDNHYFYSARMH